MDAELKKKWVDALRSGEYKQGKDRLYNSSDNSYCCLGVLAKVCGMEINEESDDIIVDGKNMQYKPIHQITCGNEIVSTNDKAFILPQMNDGNNDFQNNPQTFEQIASYIEQNL